jgi:hypothetical protein
VCEAAVLQEGVGNHCHQGVAMKTLAMIALGSDQVQAPPSTADAPAHKSILP